MTKKLGFRVTVVAELEEWDETTDAIVWLIEQRFSDIEVPTLKLETTPSAKHYPHYSLEALDSQEAHLKGWRKHEKVELDFLAEHVELPEVPLEEGEEGYVEEGYKITVERDVALTDFKHKTEKVAEYTIQGSNRHEFKIIKEEKPQ